MMRQSERDARLSRCLARLFPGGGSLLVIGERVRFASGVVTAFATLAELADDGVRHDGAVLHVHDATALAPALARLSRALSDGAPILLVAASRIGARARLTALMTRIPPTVIALEDLCGALLRAGLDTPRVHPDVAGLWLVSARCPARREALDDFFAQPRDASRR
jgi:hypothetical protein